MPVADARGSADEPEEVYQMEIENEDESLHVWLKMIDDAGKVAEQSELRLAHRENRRLKNEVQVAFTREQNFIAELAQIKAGVERYRREVLDQIKASDARADEAESRLRISEMRFRDFSEERGNLRARLVLLEDTIRENTPKSLWERLRSAVMVFLGFAASIPALPAVSEASVTEIRKAA